MCPPFPFGGSFANIGHLKNSIRKLMSSKAKDKILKNIYLFIEREKEVKGRDS